MLRLLTTLLLIGLGALACQRSADTPTPTRANDELGSATAADGAFCKEHGVLEAVCTKCTPALIPVFKAKGDWCEEHGFPESFCPICHPEKGGRPAFDVSSDGAPADGTKITFKTKETARLAGIALAKVTERPSRLQATVTARIVYDATKVAEVGARSPGVVRVLKVDVGSKVNVGSALASIESAAVGADQSRLQFARTRVQAMQTNLERLKQLHAEGLVAEKNVLTARLELDSAQSELSAAQTALGVVGGTDGSSRYTLTAPIAGVVTQRGATLGRVVDTAKVLFTIVDTSSMWAELDIPEAEVLRVALGQPVSVTVDGIADKEFAGTLDYISPEIDTHTRTAKGRVALHNPDGFLRGNQFARATIAVSGAHTALVVPRAAVQRAKSVQLVFVRVAEDAFEARRVEVGGGDAEFIEIRGRVAPGDEVATQGSFILKTETLKGSIGAGCCEVEEKR